MIKPGTLLNYLIILVLVGISLLFYTQYSYGRENEFGDFLFTITSLALIFNVIPMEIRLLWPKNVIGRRKGFNYVRLILLVLAGFAVYMALHNPSAGVWKGINKNYLTALQFLLLVFVARDNYILITAKQIRDNNLRYGTILIILKKNIKQFKREAQHIEIQGKRDTIKINLDRIREADKTEFEAALMALSR